MDMLDSPSHSGTHTGPHYSWPLILIHLICLCEFVSVQVCICVYECVCVFVCVCVCVYDWVCVVCVYIWVCVCVYIYIWLCVCVCVCTCERTCVGHAGQDAVLGHNGGWTLWAGRRAVGGVDLPAYRRFKLIAAHTTLARLGGLADSDIHMNPYLAFMATFIGRIQTHTCKHIKSHSKLKTCPERPSPVWDVFNRIRVSRHSSGKRCRGERRKRGLPASILTGRWWSEAGQWWRCQLTSADSPWRWSLAGGALLQSSWQTQSPTGSLWRQEETEEMRLIVGFHGHDIFVIMSEKQKTFATFVVKK